MNEELLISIAFPGDTYSKIVQDLEQFDDQNMSEGSNLIRKSIEFFIYYSYQLGNLYHDVPELYNQLFNCNINLISPKDLSVLVFNDTNLNAILDFLKKYDNSYFWKAFGISLEKGNSFYKEMKSYENNSEIFSKIHSEIISSGKLNKEVIVNELLSCIWFKEQCSEDSFEFVSYILFILNKISSKYPSIEEALRMAESDEDGWPKLDFLSIIQNVELLPESNFVISPTLLFELIKWADYLGRFSRNSYSIHTNLLQAKETEKQVLLNSFKMHRYGYEAYQVYLVWCGVRKIEPALKIENNPECYFYNSYKVPQIKSLYKRYFSELSEEEAKKKTKECFEEIYDSLIEEGFLDKGCRKEEFLWAFGLTDEYPFAFKKIKFKTLSGRSKKDIGNGAFLCLLTILGYTSEEIKAMLHRNPAQSSINKTFDLSLKDNTKMGLDFNALLKIVKSSGLPIQSWIKREEP